MAESCPRIRPNKDVCSTRSSPPPTMAMSTASKELYAADVVLLPRKKRDSYHLSIGRGLSGCFQNRSIVSVTSRRWNPALGHVAITVEMNVRGRPKLRDPRDTSIQSA